MKILHVGIFQDHCLGGDIIFKKGFELNGVELKTFDYRQVTADFGCKAMQKKLIQNSENKDVVFIGKGEQIEPETLKQIRKTGVIVALWYGEPPVEPPSWLIEILPHVDHLFSSTSGAILDRYLHFGVGKVSYYFNPVDPSLAKHYSPKKDKIYEVLFTGGRHSRNLKVEMPERLEVLKFLKSRRDVQFFGDASAIGMNRWLMNFTLRKKPKTIRGEAYIDAIKAAKIGIGVNVIQNQPRYTSDRMQHYMTFGSFFLPWHFPEIELFYDVGKELIVAKSVDDMGKKLSLYLSDNAMREDVALAGQRRSLSDYSTKNITAMLLQILNTGRSDMYPWCITR